MEDLLCGSAPGSLPKDLIEANRLFTEVGRRQAAFFDMVESIIVFKEQSELDHKVIPGER